MDKKSKQKKTKSGDDKKFPGYPQYPAKDDIYEQEEKKPLTEAEKNYSMGLDVPGSELDDKDEAIGEEDEENNYYSLGGDDHNDLEEEKE